MKRVSGSARLGLAVLLASLSGSVAASGSAVSAVSSAALRPDAVPSIPRGGATATQPAERLDPPAPPSIPGGAATLPPGSALPTDATCAALVRLRPEPERRQINTPFNQTVGNISSAGPPPIAGQPITGNFVGSTGEIIQWVACKWGIDVDVVRAQIAKESWWHQDRENSSGDRTTNQTACHPELRTGSGECPESIGLGQVRYPFHGAAYENENAIWSSAYNLDYTYSVWRSCFEGNMTWLNQVERGATYGAGDVWGCTGVWFSGRWHTAPAEEYIAAVQKLLSERVWETPNFQGG